MSSVGCVGRAAHPAAARGYRRLPTVNPGCLFSWDWSNFFSGPKSGTDSDSPSAWVELRSRPGPAEQSVEDTGSHGITVAAWASESLVGAGGLSQRNGCSSGFRPVAKARVKLSSFGN